MKRKPKIDWFMDEVRTIRPGMFISSWQAGGPRGFGISSEPLVDVQVSVGLEVQRIDTRTTDNKICVYSTYESGHPVSTAWMDPKYPVRMGVQRTFSAWRSEFVYDVAVLVERVKYPLREVGSKVSARDLRDWLKTRKGDVK